MKHRLATIVIAMLTVVPGFSQRLERVLPERVGMSGARLAYADSAIYAAIDRGDIPGAVLAVVKDGKMAYLKSYGYRALYPRKEKMTDNTIFDMASCSKSMSTALCVMKLVEQGKLRLGDAVADYIPDFRSWTSADGKRSTTIRIRHLLTHTSGLPPYASVEELSQRFGSPSPDSLMHYIATWKRRDFEPGEDFQYSCLNYITLQHIVEKVSGLSLREFARRYIFAPLGMYHTDYLPCRQNDKGIWENISRPVWAEGDDQDKWMEDVAPTEKQKSGQVLRGQVHDPLARVLNGGISGNAGVFTTADDIALLCQALIGGGELRGVRILSPATVRLMTTLPRGLEQFGRTPGWDMCSPYASNLGDMLSRSAYGHTGFTGTMIDIDPEQRMAIILLTNAVHMPRGGNTIRLRSLVVNAVAGAVTGTQFTPHYLDRMDSFARSKDIDKQSIVMLGNSLTENGGDWSKRLGKRGVVNRGIIGDDVPGICERLHQILPFHPRTIVLMAGVNDISHGLTSAEIATSIATTVDRIRRESPTTRLILQSLLPINESFGRYKLLTGRTDTVPALNARLRQIAAERKIEYVDLFPLFTAEGSNSMRPELSTDGLHVNEDGYKIWATELRKHL